ncbi:MAG: prepilin-type N-terminal cleavage/methylation domain-containing protein [Candidatus Riflebacteria bacterium]|nr:prepilin-type N-terminal cleavage/methylation domain-containing protein [Candidatus Riflebacteria bacterium]
MKSSFQLRKAFTIAELLLVVGVMAIVLALAAPSLYDEVVKIMIETRRVSFLASARNLASAVDLHLSTKTSQGYSWDTANDELGDYFAGIWTFYHTTDGEVGPLSKYVSLDSITYSDPELENDVVLYATFNPHTNTIRICGNDGDGVPVSKLSDLKWSDIGDAINTDVFDKRDNN